MNAVISIGKMNLLLMTAWAEEELEETPLWHGLPSINIYSSMHYCDKPTCHSQAQMSKTDSSFKTKIEKVC